MDLVSRILASAGQLDLDGLFDGHHPSSLTTEKASKTKASDRYMTSPEILGLVAAQWGEHGIDLDPCWDPECEVVAKQVMDIREGQDGLVLPWPSGAKVFVNPPYSNPEPWLARAAQHGASGGEVLCLVDASTSTKAWGKFVFPFASICFLSPRPKFKRFGSTTWTHHTKDSAVLYFGPHRSDFMRVWAPRGELVSSVRLMPACPPDLSRKT